MEQQVFLTAETTTAAPAANSGLMTNRTFWTGFGVGALTTALVVTAKMVWSGWRAARAAERAAAGQPTIVIESDGQRTITD